MPEIKKWPSQKCGVIWRINLDLKSSHLNNLSRARLATHCADPHQGLGSLIIQGFGSDNFHKIVRREPDQSIQNSKSAKKCLRTFFSYLDRVKTRTSILSRVFSDDTLMAFYGRVLIILYVTGTKLETNPA